MANETGIKNEFWISTNATGKMYPQGGTLDDPLDGSTEARFDTNMNRLPPDSTIHILAGTYQTHGGYAWCAKSGQNIIGSGMDVTVLQLAPGIPLRDAFVISSPGIVGSPEPVTNVEISDLTCDCDYSSGNVEYDGVALEGTRNAVRRVKVKNESYTPGTGDDEAWGIVLGNFSLPNSFGNTIEECEVDPLAAGHSISAISLMGGKHGNSISGSMRNNRVFLTPDPHGAQIAFNTAWVTDSQIEDNYVDGADGGYITDTGGSTNVVYAGNVFKNVYQGFVFWNCPRRNLIFAFNKISLCPTNYYFSAGFGFPDGTFHTNIVIDGNAVEFGGHPARAAASYFLCVSNVIGLVVCNNTVDSRLKNNISAPGLHLFHNYDLYGHCPPELNLLPADGRTTCITLSATSSKTKTFCFTNGVLKAVR